MQGFEPPCDSQDRKQQRPLITKFCHPFSGDHGSKTMADRI